MSIILVLEEWIRYAAVAIGLLVIGLPLVRLWLNRSSPLGRASVKPIHWTRWWADFIIAICYIAIGILLWKPIPVEISPNAILFLDIAGSIFYFPGIFLYLWGFTTLGSMFAVSSAMGAQLYQRHQLIESGPYAFLRHPMYLGVILAAMGAFLIFRTWAMLFYTPSALSVILRARHEEKLLARQFGNSWEDYCRRVPAWMPRFTLRKGGDR